MNKDTNMLFGTQKLRYFAMIILTENSLLEARSILLPNSKNTLSVLLITKNLLLTAKELTDS